MRNPCLLMGFLAILAAPIAVRADEPPLPKRTLPRGAPPVISTHQIDRYDAIGKLQQAVKSNPSSLADWVILGELSHEVAMDLPSGQADAYFQMSRDAYEKALALSPDNPGLKAAVRFARDQEANAAQLEVSRDSGIEAYLQARRRDLEATNYSPSLRVYGIPAGAADFPVSPGVSTDPAVAATTTSPVTGTTRTTTIPGRPTAAIPADGTQPPVVTNDPGAVVTNTTGADVNTANFGTQQLYSAPTYRMYYVPNNDPYTYSKYSSGYYVPSTDINPALLPMTMQRYSQQLLQRPVPPPPR